MLANYFGNAFVVSFSLAVVLLEMTALNSQKWVKNENETCGLYDCCTIIDNNCKMTGQYFKTTTLLFENS